MYVSTPLCMKEMNNESAVRNINILIYEEIYWPCCLRFD